MTLDLETLMTMLLREHQWSTVNVFRSLVGVEVDSSNDLLSLGKVVSSANISDMDFLRKGGISCFVN